MVYLGPLSPSWSMPDGLTPRDRAWVEEHLRLAATVPDTRTEAAARRLERLEAALSGEAERVKAQAEALVPVRGRGGYRDRIKVEMSEPGSGEAWVIYSA